MASLDAEDSCFRFNIRSKQQLFIVIAMLDFNDKRTMKFCVNNSHAHNHLNFCGWLACLFLWAAYFKAFWHFQLLL